MPLAREMVSHWGRPATGLGHTRLAASAPLGYSLHPDPTWTPLLLSSGLLVRFWRRRSSTQGILQWRHSGGAQRPDSHQRGEAGRAWWWQSGLGFLRRLKGWGTLRELCGHALARLLSCDVMVTRSLWLVLKGPGWGSLGILGPGQRWSLSPWGVSASQPLSRGCSRGWGDDRYIPLSPSWVGLEEVSSLGCVCCSDSIRMWVCVRECVCVCVCACVCWPGLWEPEGLNDGFVALEYLWGAVCKKRRDKVEMLNDSNKSY